MRRRPRSVAVGGTSSHWRGPSVSPVGAAHSNSASDQSVGNDFLGLMRVRSATSGSAARQGVPLPPASSLSALLLPVMSLTSTCLLTDGLLSSLFEVRVCFSKHCWAIPSIDRSSMNGMHGRRPTSGATKDITRVASEQPLLLGRWSALPARPPSLRTEL